MVMDEQMSLNTNPFPCRSWKHLLLREADALCVRVPQSCLNAMSAELEYPWKSNDTDEDDIYFYAISMIDIANKV